MPITRRQFELGVDAKVEDWMDRIRDFLAQHKNQAFTLDELNSQWEPKYKRADWILEERKVFEEALYKLVHIGMVEGRQIRDTNYYAHKEEDDVPF